MKLRVVTATRGESEFWPEAMASIQKAPPDTEHLAICPASRCSLLEKNLRIRVLAEEKLGLYAALNQGCRLEGEWDALTWVNDDDVLLAPGFGRLLDELTCQPEIEAVYGRVRLIDARGQNLGALPVARRGADLSALLSRGIVPFAQPGTVIRRSLVERLGGFDESYRLAGDLDFFARAFASGARFEFVNQWVAAFRLHAGQLSKQRAEMDVETARALQPLAGQRRSTAALWRFRLGNLLVYCDRVRRHGFVSMRELYDRMR